MEQKDLEGCVIVGTFMTNAPWTETGLAGHSYLGVVKNGKYYHLEFEGNYYEVTSFDEISYVLDIVDNYDDPVDVTTFETSFGVSDVVNAVLENLRSLVEDDMEPNGDFMNRSEGYTVDFWKDGKKIYSENVLY